MKKSLNQEQAMLRAAAIVFAMIMLISLSSCGSTSCTTRAGNYNTVR
jgi:uncharacterized lipoprotein YehR (DUF1307 family)